MIVILFADLFLFGGHVPLGMRGALPFGWVRLQLVATENDRARTSFILWKGLWGNEPEHLVVFVDVERGSNLEVPEELVNAQMRALQEGHRVKLRKGCRWDNARFRLISKLRPQKAVRRTMRARLTPFRLPPAVGQSGLQAGHWCRNTP